MKSAASTCGRLRKAFTYTLPGPPDGGVLAWTVVAATFLVYAVVVGLETSFGVLLTSMVADPGLGADRTTLAWVQSSCIFVELALGAPVGYVMGHIGARATCFAGAVLIGIGLFISSWVRSAPLLFASYSVAVGTGLALAYTAVSTALSSYFTTRRAFANCVASVGTAAGTLALSAIMARVQEEGGTDGAEPAWRASFRALALGCGAVTAVSALVFVPVKEGGEGDAVAALQVKAGVAAAVPAASIAKQQSPLVDTESPQPPHRQPRVLRAPSEGMPALALSTPALRPAADPELQPESGADLGPPAAAGDSDDDESPASAIQKSRPSALAPSQRAAAAAAVASPLGPAPKALLPQRAMARLGLGDPLHHAAGPQAAATRTRLESAGSAASQSPRLRPIQFSAGHAGAAFPASSLSRARLASLAEDAEEAGGRSTSVGGSGGRHDPPGMALSPWLLIRSSPAWVVSASPAGPGYHRGPAPQEGTGTGATPLLLPRPAAAAASIVLAGETTALLAGGRYGGAPAAGGGEKDGVPAPAERRRWCLCSSWLPPAAAAVYSSPKFWAVAVCLQLIVSSMTVPEVHLGVFAADDAGFGTEFAALLYVYTGLAGVLGRLGWGVLLLYYDVSLAFLTQLCAVTIGLAVAMLATYGNSKAYLIAFACVYGALGGTAYELGPPMLANMFGVSGRYWPLEREMGGAPPAPILSLPSLPAQLEGLAYALGGTYSLRAPTVLLAGPLAGLARDATGSYDSAWVVSGALLIAAALPLGLLSCDCRRATAPHPH